MYKCGVVGPYWRVAMAALPTNLINVDLLRQTFQFSPTNFVHQSPKDNSLLIAYRNEFFMKFAPDQCVELYVPLQRNFSDCVDVAENILKNFKKKCSKKSYLK